MPAPVKEFARHFIDRQVTLRAKRYLDRFVGITLLSEECDGSYTCHIKGNIDQALCISRLYAKAVKVLLPKRKDCHPKIEIVGRTLVDDVAEEALSVQLVTLEDPQYNLLMSRTDL